MHGRLVDAWIVVVMSEQKLMDCGYDGGRCPNREGMVTNLIKVTVDGEQ